MKTYKFYKELSGRWYVDLPEWTGEKADLEMVAGADTMLNIMAEDQDKVNLIISLEPFEGSDELRLLYEDTLVGGGHYAMESYKGIEFKLKIWLCEVTRFVFQKMPEKIYISPTI